MRVALIAVCLLLPSLAAAEDAPITKKNWRTHPRIVEIRKMVEAVDQAIKADAFKQKTKSLCEAPSLDMDRTVVLDTKARVRKYQTEGGSEDSAYQLSTYYDEAGRMRFVYGHSGAVSDSTVEHRLYFDESGKLLWKDRKTTGPGYTWIQGWPENALPRDPIAALDSAPDCKGTAQELEQGNE
jgi:hypothetical protein